MGMIGPVSNMAINCISTIEQKLENQNIDNNKRTARTKIKYIYLASTMISLHALLFGWIVEDDNDDAVADHLDTGNLSDKASTSHRQRKQQSVILNKNIKKYYCFILICCHFLLLLLFYIRILPSILACISSMWMTRSGRYRTRSTGRSELNHQPKSLIRNWGIYFCWIKLRKGH